MSLRDALKKFRVPKVETMADVRSVFDNLESVLRMMGYSLEQQESGGGGGGGAPDDSAYVLTVADVDLPNGRVLTGGVNTSVNTGTAGQVKVDVAGAPPTGSAGGHLQGTYPNPTVRPATTGQTGILQLTNHLAGTSTAPTVRSATTGQTGIVQLANHLAGTATAPTVRSATTTQTGIVELATDGESAANLAVQANDGRLSDSRDPLAHAASHQHGGGDEVATATPGANAIPKAGSGGQLATGWVPNAGTGSVGLIQLANHLGGTATAPTVRNATTGQTGIVQLTNHLGGTATAPTVRSATTGQTGVVQLATDGQSAAGLAVQANDSRLDGSGPPSGPAGGHLEGTYPDPEVREATTAQTGIVRLRGDIGGVAGTVSVEGLQGRSVSPSAPSTNDLYRWNGSAWTPWSPKYIQASLSGNQTSNLGSGDHVEFRTTDLTSGHISLSTGSGQAAGIFTLPVGTYKLIAQIHITPNSATSGNLTVQWFDITAGAPTGPQGRTLANNLSAGQSPGNFAMALVDVASGTKTVELRIAGGANVTNIQSVGTGVIIEALR